MNLVIRIAIISVVVLQSSAMVRAQDVAPAQDPCNGPSKNIDLEAQMPPADDQASSPWCATFAVKSLLDYNHHIACLQQPPTFAGQDCSYSKSNRVSASDLNASMLGKDPKSIGNTYSLVDGAAEFEVLAGAQASPLNTEESFPFDQALFMAQPGQVALITLLSQYYDKASAAPGSSCAYATSIFYWMSEKYRNDLQAILAEVSAHSGNKSDFMQGVAAKEYPVPDSVKATRKPLNPAFNINQYSSSEPNELKTRLVDLLENQHQPATTSVCMDKFGANTGVNDGLPVADNDRPQTCLGHELTLIGFRKTDDGKCEVHVRNSWGDHWPESRKGDGTTWVDANQFFASSQRDSDNQIALTSISPRDVKDPIRNQIETPKTIMRGQFNIQYGSGTVSYHLASGTKRSGLGSPNPEIASGIFSGGRFSDGHVKNMSGVTVGSETGCTYSGVVVKGVFACGLATNRDGTKHWCFMDNSGRATTETTLEACGCPKLPPSLR